MKLRDIVEEVTQEQIRKRNYYAGYDAGSIDVRSGYASRLEGREPRTDYELGYVEGYQSLKKKKPGARRDDALPAAA
jgi:hypothetical protein